MKGKIMKNSIILLLTVFILSCATPPQQQISDVKNKLIGEWSSVDQSGKQGSFIFYKDGNADMVIEGKPMEDENIKLIYFFDSSKEPMELDLIYVDNFNNEWVLMRGIVQFLTDNKIKIRSFFNDNRPEGFLAKDDNNTLILLKSK